MLDNLRSMAVSALGRRQRRPLLPNPPACCTISELPPEILEAIFLHCIPPGEWGSFSSRDAPLLLIKICRLWRGVALSTPGLWSALPFLHMHSRGGHPQLLKLYLKYSARTALSIGFELPQHPDAPSLPLITPYLPRSQCLKVAYFNDVPDLEPFIAHMHFPLLRSLELFCQYPIDDITQALQGQSTSVRLEDIQFPWNQLTQLTIPFRNTTETLTLLRHCSSLEMLRLRTSWYTWSETPHTPPEPNVVHRHLRTIAFEDGSLTGLFMGLLGCLITPALSTLEFIRSEIVHSTGHHMMQSILLFIRKSSAELTSLTLKGIKCSPQQLTDLSTLIPMVTELDLYGIDGDSLQLLTIRSDSPHGILFPRLERLVVRYHPFVYFDPEQVSYRSDMFHSRLYLAPNTAIIENVSPLRHAELHLVSLVDCGLLDFDELDRLDKWHDLQKLIRSLRSVYLGTVGFNLSKETGHYQESSTKRVAKAIWDMNMHAFPAQHELGYCAGRLPTGETIRFFRKLDMAFRALEEYRITHPLEILVNRADTLMREFSCLSEAAFLYGPTSNFPMRAALLLKRWQPMIRKYEAKDRWTCEYDLMVNAYKLVHRRAVDM